MVVILGALLIKARGFRASATPSAIEVTMARSLRNFAMPDAERRRHNPHAHDARAIAQGRDAFLRRCAICHGHDGRGATPIGAHTYPRVPDLRGPLTQHLTDGEIRYIIENGVQLTGMPALDEPAASAESVSWILVSYVRSLRSATASESAHRAAVRATAAYLGSAACARCHADIYRRWVRTPMANVVRDPREHPDAIIPDLRTNTVAPFTRDQVAFVYGSQWKQRYFTRIGDDYYPLGAQWDIGNKVWRPYHVADTGADWWTQYYPSDNLQRPTGPTCDGCHSVNYDIQTKKPAEWNVGCESCHGPGGDHAAHAMRDNVFNPAAVDAVASTDTCIQCHSQGSPRGGLIDGKAYDWPVGYRAGASLQAYWKLESHTLGETTFTHYADGTAHKNRMQGNDFVQSVMYERGVTCASCHDPHGTPNAAQLRQPAARICLECHAPGGPNGPRAATLQAHTHHAPESTGSQCVACHMPKIETQGVPGAFVSAHTFKFVSPAMTDQYKIPNPCTSCHRDKPPAWAADALRSWTGTSPWRVE
jgi:predicted CXXCH cytochrome family protein